MSGNGPYDPKENRRFLNKSPSTFCWSTSVNCVDAAIELSNQFDNSLMLIASRRQIDLNFLVAVM